MVTEKCSIHPV